MNKNIQKDFLDKLAYDRIPVTVITINGFQMNGTIVSHNDESILVEAHGRRQLVYKHAVSTVVSTGA